MKPKPTREQMRVLNEMVSCEPAIEIWNYVAWHVLEAAAKVCEGRLWTRIESEDGQVLNRHLRDMADRLRAMKGTP